MRKARLIHDGKTHHFAEPDEGSDAWLGLDREPQPGDEDQVRDLANGRSTENGARMFPMKVHTRYLTMLGEDGGSDFTILDDLGEDYQ